MRVDKKEILKMELKRTGKTYQEMADAIGMTPESIFMMISNHKKSSKSDYISLNVLKKLSAYLGKDLTWLASGDGKWN